MQVKVGHRVLVTTLLDERQVSKDDLSELYARRWNVELDLRNLKTTTGMDVLNCQTPQMNEKQLWVHLLAYNVIRLLMAQAASNAGVDPRELMLQAHRAIVDGVGLARSVGHEGLRAVVHADRPVQGGQSSRAHRAANAKATTQTLPVVEGPARPGSSKDRAPWACLGDKVSAIPVKGGS